MADGLVDLATTTTGDEHGPIPTNITVFADLEALTSDPDRLVPAWLRRQLFYRDGGCVWPGCPETHFVHAHHKQHWADCGPTDLCHLILLCGYHHRFLHEHGWRVEDDGEGKPIFIRPDGRIYPPAPPGLDPRLKELVGHRT
jgi:hypothetical protein